MKNIIDGDLLEKFHQLSNGEKSEIAKRLNKTINDIEKKLNDLKTDRLYLPSELAQFYIYKSVIYYKTRNKK